MTESLHLVCPGCRAVNRVPAERLRQTPNCGQCHAPLFAGRPVPLTAATFHKFVSRNDIPVVVDFWAPWCGPCKAMAPAFEHAARELEPAVRLAKVDTEAEPSLGSTFGIRSIPTLVIFSHGKEVARHSGAIGTADILRWVGANVRSNFGQKAS
jgi:thioredoxin 2